MHVIDTINFYIFYKYFLKSYLKLILHGKISYAYKLIFFLFLSVGYEGDF